MNGPDEPTIRDRLATHLSVLEPGLDLIGIEYPVPNAAGSDIEVVGEASDGALAISEVERTQPDVVLIDAIMSKKGGIETIRAIKDACPNVGIVVLSLHDERQLVFDAVKAGCGPV